MAKKQSSNSSSGWNVSFVRCELDSADKDALLKYDPKGTESWDVIARLIDDGYKLSVSADKAHSAVGAYLTSPKGSEGAAQFCLSARGPDIFSAFRALAYKHAIKLDRNWANGTSPDWDTGSWG